MKRSLGKIGLMAFFVCVLAPEFAQADDQGQRPFPADRPGKASGTITVEQGHFAVESDFVNYSYDKWSSSGTTTRGVAVADPLIKFGLANNADIEFQIGGYQRYDFRDASGAHTHAYGMGDDQLKLKVNLAGNDGGDFSLALIPSLKLPVASQSLRDAGVANNRVEGGLALPMTYALPHDFVAGYQFEADASKNADDNDFHPTFVNIASLGHPVPGIDDLGALVEFYSSVNTSKSVDDPNIYTLDFALTYQLAPDLAFDIEQDIGLNRGATDSQTIFGIAKAF